MGNVTFLAMNVTLIFFNIFMAVSSKSIGTKMCAALAIFCFLTAIGIRIEKMIKAKAAPAEVRK